MELFPKGNRASKAWSPRNLVTSIKHGICMEDRPGTKAGDRRGGVKMSNPGKESQFEGCEVGQLGVTGGERLILRKEHHQGRMGKREGRDQPEQRPHLACHLFVQSETDRLLHIQDK